jgi:hypothetical protein
METITALEIAEFEISVMNSNNNTTIVIINNQT